MHFGANDQIIGVKGKAFDLMPTYLWIVDSIKKLKIIVMKNLSVLAVILSIVLVSLFVISSTIKDPLTKKYNAKLQSLMEQEKMYNDSLVLVKYPAMQIVKQNLEQIKQLKMEMRKVAGNPCPNLKKEEGKAMVDCQQQIVQLYNRTLDMLEHINYLDDVAIR